ncbi:toprim domain-containing protein [Paenibacillus alvei]|uniref:toprim domain-containing protein n=1 Tax=Paenibacillus alvei TaxID=44250 RepID=UPI00227E0394|nr:toprim domain-containing protein [Paenibacillus alvei]MCY9737537.1 toprim domain-containing protein [Paenibacillus alvei]
MSDLKKIKKRLCDEEKIEDLLLALGCHNVHKENGIYAAARPNGDNVRSVQVRNNKDLNAYVRSRSISGDIYSLVAYLKFNCTTKHDIDRCLTKSKMWIVEQFGYHDLLGKKEDPLAAKRKKNDWLRKIKKKRRNRIDVSDIEPNVPIDEKVIEDYLMLPYKKWIDEGISWDTQMEWEVGFDWESGRIVTLVRNMIGELIGVKGRAMSDDDPRKYFYLHKMNKSIELFGLHKTLPYILEKRQVILFEGYKSVFKAWQYGYKNCASIEGDDISLAQVSLIKSLGIDIEIVLCLDKDKSKADIQCELDKVSCRQLSYTFDVDGLLKEKESPVDCGEEVWEYLMSNRKRYIY